MPCHQATTSLYRGLESDLAEGEEATMYHKSSRFNLALILGALVVILLGGCVASAPAPPPTLTPVPIATWIAQSVPEDTVIRVEVSDWGLVQMPESPRWVTIAANGTVAGESDEKQKFTGQVSQDELVQLLMKVAEINFFAMSEASGGCVCYITNPPCTWDSPMEQDALKTRISISIHGESKSMFFDHNCQVDDSAAGRLATMENMVFSIGERALKGMSSGVVLTPTPNP
jgi:hypothetical protein